VSWCHTMISEMLCCLKTIISLFGIPNNHTFKSVIKLTEMTVSVTQVSHDISWLHGLWNFCLTDTMTINTIKEVQKYMCSATIGFLCFMSFNYLEIWKVFGVQNVSFFSAIVVWNIFHCRVYSECYTSDTCTQDFMQHQLQLSAF
jgi:hypothetical protein